MFDFIKTEHLGTVASGLLLLALIAGAFYMFGIMPEHSSLCPYPLIGLSWYKEGENGGFKRWLLDRLTGIVLPISVFVFFFIGIFTFGEAGDRIKAQKYDNIREDISSGYTLYINGSETDIAHITLEDYSLSTITVNDDIKEVHIAANK